MKRRKDIDNFALLKNLLYRRLFSAYFLCLFSESLVHACAGDNFLHAARAGLLAFFYLGMRHEKNSVCYKTDIKFGTCSLYFVNVS